MPPPRSGDWNSVNRHLTAGGTVEGIPRENHYLNYYKSLMNNICGTCGCKKDNDEYVSCPAHSFGEIVIQEKEDNPCGKPHNNGRDTCEECLTIKEGI